MFSVYLKNLLERNTNSRLYFILILFFIPTGFFQLHAQQSVKVQTQSNLAIGRVEQGSQLIINPTSVHAANFLITTSETKNYSIALLLPYSLKASAGNSELQVEYDGSSAIYSLNSNTGIGTYFDPRQSLALHLEAGSTLYIWLGIKSRPVKHQQAGTYQANITLTVQPVTP